MAIRTFFKKARIPEAAQYVRPEDLEDDEEMRAMQIEAGYAVRRLRRVAGGDEWPSIRVQSLEELRERRERLDDLLVQRGKAGGGGEPLEGTGKEVMDFFFEADCRGGGSSNGAKPLAVEHLPGAFSSDVAARLRARAAAVSCQLGGDVGDGLRTAPASALRDDLARAVGSNGREDAAGVLGRERTTIHHPAGGETQ